MTSTNQPTPSASGPPRSAYIHVPFCRHRCGYCNFTLVAGRDDLVPAYLNALEQELQQLEAPRSVHTLFFGGGTPTHLSPQQLDQLACLAVPLQHGRTPTNMTTKDTTIQEAVLTITRERTAGLTAVDRLGLATLSIGDKLI